MIGFTLIQRSLAALRANLLRSVLSLSGITVGIFCMILIFASVDSLKRNLRSSIDSLGGDVVYIEKWPWSFAEDYPWWKYMKRPEVTLRDYQRLEGKSSLAEAMAFWSFIDVVETRKDNLVRNDIFLFGVEGDYDVVRSISFAEGRYFTPAEMHYAKDVAIIGHTLATSLFRPGQPVVGQFLEVNNKKLRIIGVFEQEGADLLGINGGFGLDKTVYVPYEQARLRFPLMNGTGNPFIMIKAKQGINLDELRYELTGWMRQIRNLDPESEENFALNTIGMLTSLFGPFFLTLNLAGAAIGIFSIAVGIFGIAIILFVSVKERTPLIGVQMALGARRRYILIEFLTEAVTLALLGGLLGILLVLGVMFLLNQAMASAQDSSFQFILSTTNVVVGLLLSVISGLIAGIFPAWKASRLNPVEAIRS